MTLVSRNLRETLTYWVSAGSDGFGGFTWDAPITMKGRWEELNVLFKTPTGEEVTSQGIAFTAIDVAVGDYIAQGDQSATLDPTTLEAATRIRQTAKNTDLGNLQTIRKAFL